METELGTKERGCGSWKQLSPEDTALRAMGTHLVTLGGNSAGLDGLVHAVGKICTLIETETDLPFICYRFVVSSPSE